MAVVDISIPFLSDTLALRVYSQKDGEVFPAPVIVLCHGFCGVQDMLLPAFAHSFAQAGYVAITFDYRGFGKSSGERGRWIPAQQQEDIRAVLNWVCANPALDSSRIALWGTSLGACHTVVVAADDVRVKCVVSQMPFADGHALFSQHYRGKGGMAAFVSTLTQMVERRRICGKELWVPISRVLSNRSAVRFFRRCKAQFPDIDIKIPFLTLDELLHFKPVLFAGRVRQPTLVVAAQHDEVNSASEARALYEALPGRKAFYVVQGATHYDLYTPKYQEDVVALAIAWFHHHL